MMDSQLLLSENLHIGLSLINSNLYFLSKDKSQATFESEETYSLFYILLNEYINAEFTSPFRKSKTTLFGLTIEYFQTQKFVDPGTFILKAEAFSNFLNRKRSYNYYINPSQVVLNISISDLINFQANISKHSFFRLNKTNEKLLKALESSGVELSDQLSKKYYLENFKEYLLDDRLVYHSTEIIEELGKYFYGFYELMLSDRIYLIKGASTWDFDINRITDLIPITSQYLKDY